MPIRLLSGMMAALLFLTCSAKGGNQALVDTSQSPYAKLEGTNLTDVRWSQGFWYDRIKLVHEVTVPHLYDVMHQKDVGKSIQNLKMAAGLQEGTYQGNDWQDAWIFKWIEMAVVAATVNHDKSLLKRIDELVTLIAQAQEEDGYIATQNTVRKRPRFQDPLHHEWYTMGHLLTAAALHHRLTGKDNFLNVAIKVGNFGYDMFRNHNQQMAHFPINPSIIMGAVELYRQTRNPQHLALANMVIDTRGRYPDGTDCWQDRVPLRKEKEVVGHAVWYTYLYAGAADAYMETGDPSLLNTLNGLWHNLVEKKMAIHGGVCPLYRGFAFRNGKVWGADEVWEAAGVDYESPNAYAYHETCGQVGNFMWNYRMLLITGQARFADLMEREMYNGFLGSMGLDGKSFFYVNPLRWHADEQILMQNSSLKRGVPGTPNIGTCCPTNYSRSLVELQGMLYSFSKDCFWIHHYGANRYDDESISIEQITDYPWDGRVKLQIHKMPRKHRLKLRIPTWAQEVRVSINGNRVKDVEPGTYFAIKRRWASGDTVILDCPMAPRLVIGHPKIEATRGQVAVMRGPLLYALEECDLPDDVEIEEVVIPKDIDFQVAYEPQRLGGVTILKGKASALKQPDWRDKLYLDLDQPEIKSFPLELIPYYTWANRGINKMTVWMPVDL